MKVYKYVKYCASDGSTLSLQMSECMFLTYSSY